MEITEEQLAKLIDERINANRHHTSLDVLEFKREVKDWAHAESENKQISYNMALNTINGVIRLKLKDLSSMSGLSDEHLPAARQAIEDLKRLVQ